MCGLDAPAGSDAGTSGARSDSDLGYLCMRVARPMQALALVASAWDASAIVVQSCTALAPMVLASLKTGRPTTVYLHNVETYRVEGNLTPHPSLLYLANSEFTAQRWAALYGLGCEVIPPVIRAEAYLAERTGTNVLFVNPAPIKGVELMFALAAHCPDVSFLVVESWSLEANWLGLCRHRAQALGNVQWLAPVDDMRPVFAQTSLLLMPSVWEESFGRMVVEAQLNGIPVLASTRGELPQNVGSGGLTVDVHAPVEAWAAALRHLLAQRAAFSSVARVKGLGHAAATPLIVAKLLGLLVEHAARQA